MALMEFSFTMTVEGAEKKFNAQAEVPDEYAPGLFDAYRNRFGPVMQPADPENGRNVESLRSMTDDETFHKFVDMVIMKDIRSAMQQQAMEQARASLPDVPIIPVGTSNG